jgi:hypothetical protein
MAEQDSTTEQAQESQEKKDWVPGPKAVEDVKDRLLSLAAFAFLGKRAFMEGDYSEGGWEKYLRSIGNVFTPDSLTEAAFEGLLKMACDMWNELFDPKDAVEGQVIDRTVAAPGGGEA